MVIKINIYSCTGGALHTSAGVLHKTAFSDDAASLYSAELKYPPGIEKTLEGPSSYKKMSNVIANQAGESFIIECCNLYQ